MRNEYKEKQKQERLKTLEAESLKLEAKRAERFAFMFDDNACLECGAIIQDKDTHFEWHVRLDPS